MTLLDINCFNKTVVNIPYKDFLCLMTDDTLTWGNHIDQLISGLKSAYYAITAVQIMFSRKTFRMLYFDYVHSVLSYGIIFRCNTANNNNILRMQK